MNREVSIVGVVTRIRHVDGRGHDTPLGVNWADKFRSRHTQVLAMWTRLIDTSRLAGASPDQLAPWFAEAGLLMTRHQIKPSNIFNMDKTGFGIGTMQATRVLCVVERGQKEKGKAWKGRGPQQEWVISIKYVCAAGHALPPLVIFKGAAFNSRYLPTPLINQVAGWRWTTSNTGWSNDTLAYEWITCVFEPLTATPDRRLLIVDGHGSHVRAPLLRSASPTPLIS